MQRARSRCTAPRSSRRGSPSCTVDRSRAYTRADSNAASRAAARRATRRATRSGPDTARRESFEALVDEDSEGSMEIKAAVCRKTHEPLTIESIDVDKPWGREVLVRTVATGVCHSDLHVVDGGLALPARPPHRARPRGRGRRRGRRRRRDDGAPGRSRRRVPLGVLRQLRAVPLAAIRTSASAGPSRGPTPRRPGSRSRASRLRPVHRHRQLRRAHAAARELDREDRPRAPARPRRAGRLRRAHRRRRGAAELGPRGGTDGGRVRLRRRRALDRPGRAHRRRAPDHRASTCSTASWRWRSASARRTS